MGWFNIVRSLFQSGPLNESVYATLGEMLRITHQMFRQVTEPLFVDAAHAPTREEVLELDRQVNRLEEQARREILTRVAVNPNAHATSGLLAMRLLQDAERCGDYAKSIFDVFEDTGTLTEDDCVRFLREQYTFILKLFVEVWAVFERGDEAAASRLIEEGRPLNRRGAEIVHGLLRGAPCPHPVAVALLLRFFRRIQSHLIHIAQAVVIPAGRLESRRDERRP